MAANIPDSRLGRALRAGIPVALILLGAELLEGTFKVERGANGMSLSWSSPTEGESSHAVRLVSCAQGRCEIFTVPLSFPRVHAATATVSMIATVIDLLATDCPEQRRARMSMISA